MLKLKMSPKGEIVIPKKIREELNMGGQVLIQVHEERIELKPIKRNLAEKWESDAKKYNLNVSKWRMGDDLYEDAF